MRYRIIPTLQLKNEGLVKSKKFADHTHLGDPENIVRIFNELEVDELCLMDISAHSNHNGINFELIAKITSECFMPLSYGGGITTMRQADRLFEIGIEKIILNTITITTPTFVREISLKYGAQATVASVDVMPTGKRHYKLYNHKTGRFHEVDLFDHCRKLEDLGVGEILLTDVKNDGSYTGYNLDLIEKISKLVKIPVIASGGVRNLSDMNDAIAAGASAVAVGSLFVFHKKDNGVLVNVPSCMVR